MSYVVYRAENDKFLLEVDHDEYGESPREWDNIGTMVYGHRTYDLGDEKAQNIEEYNSWHEWLRGEVIAKHGEDNVIALPLYLYDHSGLTMNTTGFSCRWDSGQVGWIYATKETFLKETAYNEKKLFEEGKAEEMLRNEVDIFDKYIRGDVYCFVLSKKETCDCCKDVSTDVVDSCCGFYADDLEELKEQLREHLPEEAHDLLEDLEYAY